MSIEIILFISAIFILLAGGLLTAFISKFGILSGRIGSGSAISGGLLGFAAVVLAHIGEKTVAASWPSSIPFMSFSVKIDPLAGFFLLIVFTLSPLAAVYGFGYLSGHGSARQRGFSWLFYNLLTAGMALVIAAANGVLLIIAWEVMSFAAFFLVTFDNGRIEVQKAGFIYLIAAHIGVIFLFAAFWLLAVNAGHSMDFDSFENIMFNHDRLRHLIFILGLIGFGAKAGFIPFHVWLPEAHPAAPSHVSALMSGVMIKTGIYGILRMITFLGNPPAWWGITLIVIGLLSALSGILFALAQNDLKRFLAYSSVENIGIIATGMGIGLLGISYGNTAMTVAGFGGALLHVLNHSFFKSLLFMGAGVILHQTHTVQMNRLGGLIKKMPVTAVLFITGAAAISGLPPLNGFISEFIIYIAALTGVTELVKSATIFPLAVILGLAAVGGLAVYGFTRSAGIIFLGEPRSEAGQHASDPGWNMRFPMLILAGLCLLIGIWPRIIWPSLSRVIGNLTALPPEALEQTMSATSQSLMMISVIAVSFLALFTLLFFLRRLLLRARPTDHSVTWDCGYMKPVPRMQYTASSFTQPIVAQGEWLLQQKQDITLPEGYFPEKAGLKIHVVDTFTEKLFQPLFAAIAWLLSRLEWMQHGRISLYILYIAVVLLALLFWFGGLR